MSNKILQNTSNLQDILEVVNNLPDAGGSEPVLQDKTVTPTTSFQTVTADDGYDGLNSVIVNAMPTATQATPNITINTSGLITATATQTAGYVGAGTKSATKQLAFQPAKTITPTTTSQTAVSSGYYTGGAVTVKGDSNLIAGNIKSGVSIFGVNGTYEGSSSTDDPFAPVSPFAYTVDAISEASYGFALNSNGYYESQNKGQNNSYAICRVNLTVTSTCDIIFDVINYAESNYDYALFGNLDSALALSSSADSSVKKNFKGQQSASVVNVTYSGVTAGSHYIDIKFIKDTSQHSNNDSVQFKLQYDDSLPEETINKILAADTDLKAENIKSGVNIFGVSGTYEGSGGSSGDTSIEDAFVTGTLTTYTNDRVSSIGDYAFYSCYTLTSVNFPACSSIGVYAFGSCYKLAFISFPACINISGQAFTHCSNLTSVNFPVCTTMRNNVFGACRNLTSVNFPVCSSIGAYAFTQCSNLITVYFPICTIIDQYAFDRCISLTSVNFPACITIGGAAFVSCSKLTLASFPVCTNIRTYAFSKCSNLKSIYLLASSVCTLSNSNAFSNAGITTTTGSIFVPASLVDAYKTATNWTYFSNRIFSYNESGGAE